MIFFNDVLVMSSAFDVKERANMTLHTSQDGGKTWSPKAQVCFGNELWLMNLVVLFMLAIFFLKKKYSFLTT